MATGFEGLHEMIKSNKAQPTIEEEALKNKLCPECIWPLKENEKGELICQMCGVYYGRI
jgi:uncharacterized Zn finger protein (UPF0148 family)